VHSQTAQQDSRPSAIRPGCSCENRSSHIRTTSIDSYKIRECHSQLPTLGDSPSDNG